MITLQDYMEAVEYRITETGPYIWLNYGPNAHSLTAWNGSNDVGGWSVECVFDTQDQTVYEMAVCDYDKTRAYRWVHPDYRKALDAEYQQRGVKPETAWDFIDWTELEVPQDILEKSHAIVRGQPYDARIMVQVEFTDQELLEYMRFAHEQDITFNQLVEQVLQAAIDRGQHKEVL
jgi:hypothetical protein